MLKLYIKWNFRKVKLMNGVRKKLEVRVGVHQGSVVLSVEVRVGVHQGSVVLSVEVRVGVHQGSVVLSALLFIIVMEVLSQRFNLEHSRFWQQPFLVNESFTNGKLKIWIVEKTELTTMWTTTNYLILKASHRCWRQFGGATDTIERYEWRKSGYVAYGQLFYLFF